MSSENGTDLLRRILAFDYGDTERADLMRKVWSPTPWVVEIWSGGHSNHYSREWAIQEWCHDKFGRESSPIHEQQGQWHRGSATVNGMTWYGFATEAQMNAFIVAWGDSKMSKPREPDFYVDGVPVVMDAEFPTGTKEAES